MILQLTIGIRRIYTDVVCLEN